jgi:hypothetical protein
MGFVDWLEEKLYGKDWLKRKKAVERQWLGPPEKYNLFEGVRSIVDYVLLLILGTIMLLFYGVVVVFLGFKKFFQSLFKKQGDRVK